MAVDIPQTPQPGEIAPAPEPALCSARGCRLPATTALQWRNPKLHEGARTKLWQSCDNHADQLADFLDRRGFLLARKRD